MNPDSIDSTVTKIAIALLSWFSGRYLPADLGASFVPLIPSLAAAIGALAVFIYAIWRSWNLKRVPQTATALQLATPPVPKGSIVDLTPMTGLAKVVG